MKGLFLTVGVICSALFTGCIQATVTSAVIGSSQSDLKFTTNMVQHGEVSTTLKSLEIENPVGDIDVIGTEGNTAKWSCDFEIRTHDEADGRIAVTEPSCTATVNGDHCRIAVKWPEQRNRSYRSKLKVTIPKSVPLETRTAYGETHIENLSRDVRVFDRSGSIMIRSIEGKVKAETSYASMRVVEVGSAELKNRSGSIEAANVKGELEAETSYATLNVRGVAGSAVIRNQSGSVDARDIQGNVDVKTSYASLELKNVHGNAVLKNQLGLIDVRNLSGTVRADTSYAALRVDSNGRDIICHNQSGQIELHVRSSQLTNLVAKTSYASLDVNLPTGLQPAVQARTSYADIESDFPVLMKREGTDPFSDIPVNVPRINLRNQSGRIRVSKQ